MLDPAQRCPAMHNEPLKKLNLKTHRHMPRTYDPATIDMPLVAAGFERRFGPTPALLTERLQVVKLFVDGSAPDHVAMTLKLRLGQVQRTLGFAVNLSTQRDRSGKPAPKAGTFKGLSLRIQNVFAAEQITTREAARALFDENFNPIRKLPKLGSTSLASVARWLGHRLPPHAMLGSKNSDARLSRAISLLERNGYEVTRRPEYSDPESQVRIFPKTPPFPKQPVAVHQSRTLDAIEATS